MKTNLVKILALLAMTVSLGACTGQKQQGGGSSEASSGSSEQQSSESETSSDTSESESSSQEEIEDLGVVSLGEVLDLNNDNEWNYLGKKMTVEHLVMQGKYGNTIIAGGALGQYISDLRGLEVQCAEFPTFEVGSGWGADLTVTGILDDVNGRAVLKEAEVTVNSERVYNEDRTSYTGGLPVYMWPEVYMDRGNFDYYMGRNMSGIYLAGTFQLAQKPEVITADGASVFYAAFPGEYLDVEDEDNVSILTFQVPAGLSDAAVTAFNAYFAEKNVGDFFTFEGCGQYDAIENIGYGFVVDSWAAQSFVDPAEEPVLYSTWESVTDEVNAYYADELPAIGDDDLIFNYTFDVYQGKTLNELFTDLTYVYITDKENCLFSEFSFYAAPSEMDDAFDSVVAKAKTAGYEAAVEQTGAALLTLKDSSDNVISQIDVFEEDAYLDIYYFGIPFATEFDSFAGLAAAYNHRAAKKVAGFATELVDTATAGLSYNIDFAYEEYFVENGINGIYEYDLSIEFAELSATAVADYTTLLAAAGFEEKYFSLVGATGLFNAENNEFVIVYTNAEKKLLCIDALVFTDAAAATYITDPLATYDSFADLKVDLDAAFQDVLEEITGEASTFEVSFDLSAVEGIASFSFDDSLAINQYTASNYAAGYLMTVIYLEIELDDEADFNTVVAAIVAALEAAGFEEAVYNGQSIGYYNETTGEFIRIFNNDGNVELGVNIYNAKTAAYYLTTLAEYKEYYSGQLQAAYDALDLTEYDAEGQAALAQALADGLEAINNATGINAVVAAYNAAAAALAAVEKISA